MDKKEEWISRKGSWHQLKHKIKRVKTFLKAHAILEPSLVAFDHVFPEAAMETKGLPKKNLTGAVMGKEEKCYFCS